jgi:hypothetical protein
MYAGNLADNGKNRVEIASELLPETKYHTINAIDQALMRAFRDRGWDLPPLYLTRAQLRQAHRRQQRGANMTAVVRVLRSQTSYTSLLSLEREIVRCFDLYGWERPEDTPEEARRRHTDRRFILTPEHLREIRAMERQLRAIESLTK